MNFQIYQHETSMKIFSKLVKMFRVLKPYTEHYMQEHYTTGLPLQRPLFLHYENDVTAWNISYQYMYGRDLLVAPVLQPSHSTWNAYLPAGEDWVHLFQGTVYKGGQTVTVLAPIGTPPVFYRETSDWKQLFKEVAAVLTTSHSVKTEL